MGQRLVPWSCQGSSVSYEPMPVFQEFVELLSTLLCTIVSQPPLPPKALATCWSNLLITCHSVDRQLGFLKMCLCCEGSVPSMRC